MKIPFWKAALTIGFLLVIGIFLYGLCYSPIDKPNVKVKCREEMLQMYGILMEEGDRMAMPNIPSAVGERLLRFNAEVGREIYSVKIVNGKFCPVDLWGNPYNFMSLSDCVKEGRHELYHSTFGNCALWSSGPNGVNEFGKGDDVVMWRRPHGTSSTNQAETTM